MAMLQPNLGAHLCIVARTLFLSALPLYIQRDRYLYLESFFLLYYTTIHICVCKTKNNPFKQRGEEDRPSGWNDGTNLKKENKSKRYSRKGRTSMEKSEKGPS
jgi:hypothetical protein